MMLILYLVVRAKLHQILATFLVFSSLYFICQIKLIEDRLISGTGRKRTILRVRTGGPEFEWLMQNVAVYDVETDAGNANFSLLHALLLDLELSQFRKFFVRQADAVA